MASTQGTCRHCGWSLVAATVPSMCCVGQAHQAQHPIPIQNDIHSELGADVTSGGAPCFLQCL